MSPAPAAAVRAATTAAQAGSAAPRQAPRSRPVAAQRPRPALRVVPQRHAPARAPFVLLVSAILGGGLVLVLLINTSLAQGSFTVKRLQEQQSGLRTQTQAIAQQIAAQAAPDALAIRAAELGMVAAPNPVFKTTNGAVLGVASKAVRPAPPPPPPTATPSASPSASPQASASASASAGPKPSSSASASPKPSADGSPKASPDPSPKPSASTSAKASAPAKPSAPAKGGHG